MGSHMTGTAGDLCLILQPIHAIAERILADAGIGVIDGSDAGDDSARVVALISRNAPVGPALIDALPRLRVIAKHGAGLDAIDVDHAARRGVHVIFTPQANSVSTAEHAMALMVGLAKHLRETDAATRQGDFSIKFRIHNIELASCTLGIVGFGNVGRHVARIAGSGFGMRVLAFSPSVPDAIFAEANVERRTDLHDMLSACDFISIHLPDRPGAKGMIGEAEFAAMRPGAIVVNVGRGGVVDEAAAARALASGRLGGLGLDVFEREPADRSNPLFNFANVLATPHIAGSSAASLERMARSAAEQIVIIVRNGRGALHLANRTPGLAAAP